MNIIPWNREKDVITALKLRNWMENIYFMSSCTFVCVCVCMWLVSSEECSFCLLGLWGGRGLLFGLRLAPRVEGLETALPQLGPAVSLFAGECTCTRQQHTHAVTRTLDALTRQQMCLCTPLAATTAAATAAAAVAVFAAALRLNVCGRRKCREGAEEDWISAYK